MNNKLSNENIEIVLKSYFLNRFQEISPLEFEHLIKILLEKKYGTAEVTNASGDFGADVIAYNAEDEKIVCQVKRYKKGSKVGNKYINDCIAAIEYYNGAKGLVVTTSDFTKSAHEIASKAKIDLWNWNTLSEEISKIFFEGKDYYEYFPEKSKSKDNDLVEVSLDRIEHSYTSQGSIPTNWFYVIIENLTEHIIDVTINEVVIIDSNKRQYNFDGWHDGYFSGGKIYPGAKVEVSFYVTEQKAGQLKSGTKVYFKIELNNNEELHELTYEEVENQENNLIQGNSDQELIKEDFGDKIYLKSPVNGEFLKRVSGTKGQEIYSDYEIGEINGVIYKAGCEGFVKEFVAEHKSNVENGQILLILDKEYQERENEGEFNKNNESKQNIDEVNKDLYDVFLALVFVIVVIIIVMILSS